MKLRRAEAGIILIILSNFPFFGLLFFFFLWFIFSFVGSAMIFGFLSTLTAVGLILLVSDKEGFSCRMKGNRMVVAFLIIFGLLLAVQGFLSIFFVSPFGIGSGPPDYKPTSEELTIRYLYQVWSGLASISGILWIVHGFKIWKYEKTDFSSFKQMNEQPDNLNFI